MTTQTSLSALLEDVASKQKKGLPFVTASICIWGLIVLLTLSPLSLTVKNILTLSCGALVFPVSMMWAKVYGVDLFYKDNPLVNGL